MTFWPYWQPSSNKLVIFIISAISFYVCCLWKINSSSSSSTAAKRTGAEQIARRTDPVRSRFRTRPLKQSGSGDWQMEGRSGAVTDG